MCSLVVVVLGKKNPIKTSAFYSIPSQSYTLRSVLRSQQQMSHILELNSGTPSGLVMAERLSQGLRSWLLSKQIYVGLGVGEGFS